MAEHELFLGNIKGPQGDEGPRGPEGPEGPRGEQGDTGLQGDPGKDAVIASATATADNTHSEAPTVTVDVGGEPGAQTLSFTFTGLQGKQGVPGDKGDAGDPGLPGKDGANTEFATDEEIAAAIEQITWG